MSKTFTAAELEAYLDEALSPQEMAAIELELRKRPDLLRQLAEINNRRDAGIHSISAVWRRNRVSCPTRQQLGSFLLGAIDPQTAEYITFHVVEQLQLLTQQIVICIIQTLVTWQIFSLTIFWTSTISNLKGE